MIRPALKHIGEWVQGGRHLLLSRPFLPLSLKHQLLYSPFLSQLVVTNWCNLACGYCNEFKPSAPLVPFEVLRERVNLLYRLGTLAIEFTGGEPLLHEGLIPLVAHATSLGFPARMLISNAYLMTEETVEDLNRAGLTHLQVSIDGMRENEMTRKTADHLEPQLRMLSRKKAFTVQLNAVIGACDPKETIDVLHLARELSFLPRVLLLHDHEGQLKLGEEELSAFKAAKEEMGEPFSESHGYRERILRGQEAPYHCRAGSRYLYVDEEGMVHRCAPRREVFGKRLEDYGLEDLREQFRLGKECNPLCTVGCARTVSSWDEWRYQEEPKES